MRLLRSKRPALAPPVAPKMMFPTPVAFGFWMICVMGLLKASSQRRMLVTLLKTPCLGECFLTIFAAVYFTTGVLTHFGGL